MIKFQTLNSIYEIDETNNRFRKGEGEWRTCKGTINFANGNRDKKYEPPIVGSRYLIISEGGENDALTTTVKEIL